MLPRPYAYGRYSMDRSALVCHCFSHTVRDITDDALANGRSTILERILEAKRHNACQCATTNPKGT